MTDLTKGTPVRYYPGFRDGPSRVGRIQYETGPRELGGTTGYYITGAGFVSLGHIEVLPMPREGVIKVLTVKEALEVCDWEGITDVVITDQAERIKLQKLMKGMR